MPSPFPGMDPYIEASGRWGDFHGSLLADMRIELNTRLPRNYVASIELYVWTEEPESARGRKPVEPDVYVREEKRRKRTGARAAGVAAPMTIVLPAVERKKRKYLQIQDIETKRVVTVVEVLSPSNKAAGADREAYLTKRSDYLASRVSLVEIDLLRGGRRPPLGEPAPEMADYYVMVCRSWKYPEAGFWAFGLRDPLPDVPVPLAPDLSETILPLRPCVDRAYDGGRYAQILRYDRPLTPRPRRQDAAWLREVLASRTH